MFRDFYRLAPPATLKLSLSLCLSDDETSRVSACTRPLAHIEFQNGNERFYIRVKDRRWQRRLSRRRDGSVS